MERTTPFERARSRHRWIGWPLVVGAMVAACGGGSPPVTYNCCLNGLYYVCPTELTSGQCSSKPGNASGCSYQQGLECPPPTATSR